MQLQDMAQNSFFPDVIKCEATKVQANAHHHNCLPGKDIVPKTTHTFLTTSCELYRAIVKAVSELKFLLFKFFVRFITYLYRLPR